MMHNAIVMKDLYARTMDQDSLVIRSSEVKELMNQTIVLDSDCPFLTFPSRKLNINYFKKEMIWKLGANPHDESIKDHAKMWASVQNLDGTFNSNYGQYWFGEQAGLYKAFNELVRDNFTRRAVIPMLSAKHVGPHVKDQVCTGYITFHIRPDYHVMKLEMSVSMRSSDQIFGLGTDIPTFASLHRIMLGMLNSVYDRELFLGSLSIHAVSSHIYSRHFDMVNSILKNDEHLEPGYRMPSIKPSEAFKLAACGGDVKAEFGEFSAWLLDN